MVQILTSKKLTNANEFNLSSCLLRTHAALLVIRVLGLRARVMDVPTMSAFNKPSDVPK